MTTSPCGHDSLLERTFEVLLRLTLRNAQRAPRWAREVLREQDDLTDMIGGVCRQAVQRLDDEKGFAANRDRSSQIVTGERLQRRKGNYPGILPQHVDLVPRYAFRHFELGVAVAVGFLTVGLQE